MMSNFFIVLAAVLGAGGPLMWFLTLFDKRNTDQHRNNMDLLKNIQHLILNTPHELVEAYKKTLPPPPPPQPPSNDEYDFDTWFESVHLNVTYVVSTDFSEDFFS
jgi:hypothetical protein